MLNDLQYKMLLSPLNSNRVSKRSVSGRSLSYVEAWDIKRTLIRIFGFGGWSWEVLDADVAFIYPPGETGSKNFKVGYKVRGRLTIPSLGCAYTEAAVGTANLPDAGEAHDMAVKTAESDALKRAAICLGTQFGLSLYQNGATGDVVQRTLDRESLHGVATPQSVQEAAAEAVTPVATYDDPPVAPEEPAEAAQEPSGAPAASEEPTEAPKAAQEPSEDALRWIEALRLAVQRGSVPAVLEVKAGITKAKQGRLMYQGRTLAKWCDEAVIKAGKGFVADVSEVDA